MRSCRRTPEDIGHDDDDGRCGRTREASRAIITRYWSSSSAVTLKCNGTQNGRTDCDLCSFHTEHHNPLALSEITTEDFTTAADRFTRLGRTRTWRSSMFTDGPWTREQSHFFRVLIYRLVTFDFLINYFSINLYLTRVFAKTLRYVIYVIQLFLL